MPWCLAMITIQIPKQQVGCDCISWYCGKHNYALEESVFEGSFVLDLSATATGRPGFQLPSVAFENGLFWCETY